MLTKKEVFEHTIEQWSESKKEGLKVENFFLHNCACCEYVMQQLYGDDWREYSHSCCMNSDTRDSIATRIHCIEFCPMNKLWPNGCESDGSPYKKLSEADDSNDWTNPANEIINHAKKELEKLNEK